MKLYIQSSSCISAQNTFLDKEGWSDILNEIGDGPFFKITEIPYKEFINPRKLRRMKRNVRMGICCAQDALKNAGLESIDGIFVGSSLGIVQDTEIFLNQINSQDEQMLNPTAFIQSTHNTVAGQIALTLKCHSHNLTFSQLNASFEHSLLDAALHLGDEEASTVLVGAQDELTDENFDITNHTGLWKKSTDFDNLYSSNTSGTIAGEGAAYFVLSKEQGSAKACITNFDLVLSLRENDLNQKIIQFLKKNNLTIADLDAVVLGMNGDVKQDVVYQELAQKTFANQNILAYKHLVGDYPTSSAFAFWLVNETIGKQEIPECAFYKKASDVKEIKNVLIYHQENGQNHCLSLIQKV